MRTTRPSASRPTTSSEVQTPARAVRTQAEKIRIVQEYDAFPAGAPERGALLRREGVYSSHMARWRKLLSRVSETPARSPQQFAALSTENERLRLELSRVQVRLSQAETVIDVQKKLALLLGQMPLTRNEP